jgi:hypothetical protein
VILWGEGEGSPRQPFCRGAKRSLAGQVWWPGGKPMWPLSLYFVPKVRWLIVEGKGRNEGEGGGLATNLWPGSHTWPPFNSHFHSSPHLASVILTPLSKSIKSKANSITPTSCKNKNFCANRSAYKNAYQIIVLVKNFQKIILHRMHCMAWHIIFF